MEPGSRLQPTALTSTDEREACLDSGSDQQHERNRSETPLTPERNSQRKCAKLKSTADQGDPSTCLPDQGEHERIAGTGAETDCDIQRRSRRHGAYTRNEEQAASRKRKLSKRMSCTRRRSDLNDRPNDHRVCGGSDPEASANQQSADEYHEADRDIRLAET
jgi:hypothetical protein